MPLRMTASDVSEIGPSIWAFEMPPHQVRHFGTTSHAVGARSVILLRACEYDAAQRRLEFELEDVVPVNVGTTSRVIGIAAEGPEDETATLTVEGASAEAILGPGDREFLRLARSELTVETARAAEELLLGVRQRSAGNLKRGKTRNFSETPDNFWYVIVQPQIDELSITVRGTVERFRGLSELDVKDDRGNTRFKVRSSSDVPSALKLIFHAVRKA